MKMIVPIPITDTVLTSSNVPEADYPAYSAATAYTAGTFVIVVSTNVHKIYQSLQGTASAVTITIAAPGVVTWALHGLAAGTPVIFTTTGALPTGITANTLYYVLAPTANTFTLAATVGGTAITTSGSQSGTHTAIGNPNKNNAPASAPLQWLDYGATNRWNMLDVKWDTQTVIASPLTVSLTPSQYTDSIALMNINGESARVTVTSTTGGGTVYDSTQSLVNDTNIVDWYTYFFAPFIYKTDLVLTNLPPYIDAVVTVSITASSGSVKIGNCVIGSAIEMGGTQYNATIGIVDYSIKSADQWGNSTIVQRKYSKRMGAKVIVKNNYMDEIVRLLALYRSQPIVWIGADNFYTSLIVYGYYKDFEVDLAFPTESYCSLTIEGLT